MGMGSSSSLIEWGICGRVGLGGPGSEEAHLTGNWPSCPGKGGVIHPQPQQGILALSHRGQGHTDSPYWEGKGKVKAEGYKGRPQEWGMVVGSLHPESPNKVTRRVGSGVPSSHWDSQNWKYSRSSQVGGQGVRGGPGSYRWGTEGSHMGRSEPCPPCSSKVPRKSLTATRLEVRKILGWVHGYKVRSWSRPPPWAWDGVPLSQVGHGSLCLWEGRAKALGEGRECPAHPKNKL